MDCKLSIKTIEEFRDAVYAFRLPRILTTALDIDLFTQMGTRWWSTLGLAKELKVNERGLNILLRNLETVGLLKKKGISWKSSRLGRLFLNRNSLNYQGEYLELLHHQWENWSNLTDVVRNGKPIEDEKKGNASYRRSFTWAMHQRSLKIAKKVVAQIKLKDVKSLLDVGGGPGTYALEFLRKHPKMKAAIWDREPAIEIAKIIAKPLRHSNRLMYHAGDFFRNKVPGTFDMMWLSNVIHIYSPEENKKLFRKLKRALNPGGRILIQDTFLMNKPGMNKVETNLFAVTMLLFTKTGNTYSARDVLDWLKTCGMKTSHCLYLKKGTGDWDGIIIEAAI